MNKVNSDNDDNEMSAYDRQVWRAQQRRDWRDWQVAHPHFCRMCAATGERYVGGDGVLEPREMDECPACVGQECCPWCGGAIIRDEDDGNETWVACANDDCDWELGEYPH